MIDVDNNTKATVKGSQAPFKITDCAIMRLAAILNQTTLIICFMARFIFLVELW